MSGSMVDIQSPTAEIRRGKKVRKKEDRAAIKINICNRLTWKKAEQLPGENCELCVQRNETRRWADEDDDEGS